ncbi:MAG TPA: PAS domain S-box protein, partial [Spirochaetota bacterium]|nr:PAS domain S-box protein [Spirochaetota bacterium]
EPYGYILKPFDRREVRTNIEIAVYKHRIQNDLKQKEIWYKSIVKSIGDAVIVADKKGNIKFENEQSEELTGFKVDEIKGKNINRFFQVVSDKGFENPNDLYYNLSNELVLVNKEGNKIPIYENATPVRDKQGNITGIVMTFHRR